MIRVRRALLSVSDKTGLVPLAASLHALGVELLSTGGTAAALREADLPVREVAELTGVPEMLDGRVKTLHPIIHAGILARRGDPVHGAQLQAQGIRPVDLVVVNLYPFEAAIAAADLQLADAIEQIDIGGPALLRSAAKNFEGVAVVADPADYPGLLGELQAQGGQLSRSTRFALAGKAFAHTARYDAAIAAFFAGRAAALDPTLAAPAPERFPALLHLAVAKVQELRYGENPHQAAALYRDLGSPIGVAGGRQLQGKSLSYNNLVDLQAAWDCVQDFEEPTVAIVKHTNPCGVASGPDQATAYERARATDPVSAYGAIVGLNRPLEAGAAEAIAGAFVEAIAAPGFTPAALHRLQARKNLRLLEVAPAPRAGAIEFQRLSGGLLVQTRDDERLDPATLRPVTRRAPSAAELEALRFAWRVVKHVKSNAIVLAVPGATVGVGAGQMSRVDAVRLAISKAAFPTAGAVLASDAFFPFADGVETAAGAGVTAVIQPGGSVRDDEVIAAADARGLAMVFTGRRHFRH